MRLFFWFISSLLSLHNKAQCISRGSVHFSLLPILFYIQDTETSQSWGRSSPRCQSHSPFCFCSVEGVMPRVCCQSCENANITGNSHSWVSPNPLSGVGLLLKLGKTGKNSEDLLEDFSRAFICIGCECKCVPGQELVLVRGFTIIAQVSRSYCFPGTSSWLTLT